MPACCLHKERLTTSMEGVNPASGDRVKNRSRDALLDVAPECWSHANECFTQVFEMARTVESILLTVTLLAQSSPHRFSSQIWLSCKHPDLFHPYRLSENLKPALKTGTEPEVCFL